MMYFFSKGREPINSFTHVLGALLSLIGLFLIIGKSLVNGVSIPTLVTCIIFCISLILLYTSSGIYHYSNGGNGRVLRLKKLDHAMIYVLIAGSYTPVLYTVLPSPQSYYYIAAIWIIGIGGVIAKIMWIDMPRWLSTVIYIAMGWFILIKPSALAAFPLPMLVLLFLGGISYTLGGLIYWTKRPNFLGKFGYHEVFHIFILVGSLFHYLMVFLYIA